MMIGRGLTTCLICNKDGIFVLNNPGTVMGIGVVYSSNKFNLMLSSTHICIKCTGRLHQLFDFNILKNHLETVGRSSEACTFCGSKDLMIAQHEAIALKAVSRTKWRQPDKYEDKDHCCYSCYNHLLLYIKIEEILNHQLPEFLKLLNCWRVELTKCDELCLDAKEIELLTIYEKKKAVEFVEVKSEKIESDVAINLIEMNTLSEQNKTTEEESHLNEVQIIAEPLNETRQRRKRKSETHIMLCEAADSLPPIDVDIDKFSLIKKRRSFNRPSILPSKAARTPKKPQPTVKPEGQISTQGSQEVPSIDQSIPVAAPEIEVHLEAAALPITQTKIPELPEVAPSNSQITTTTSSCSEISTLQSTEIIATVEPKSDLAEELNEVIADSFPSQEDDDSNPMFGAVEKSHSNPLGLFLPNNNKESDAQVKEISFSRDSNIELNLIKDLDFNLSLFPQLEDVCREETVDEFTAESFLTANNYHSNNQPDTTTKQATAVRQEATPHVCERYNLKKCSIVIERIPDNNLDDFAAKWLEQKRLTKSGRISKPKVIADPSVPARTKRKTKTKAMKKAVDQPLKHLKSKQKVLNGQSDTLLLHVDEPLELYEIEEAYVDYAIELESSREEDLAVRESQHLPSNETDDDVIEVFSAKIVRQSSTTTLEFLSPSLRGIDPACYGSLDAIDEIMNI